MRSPSRAARPPFRCRFAASVAGSLAQLTREIAGRLAGWRRRSPSPISRPGPANQTYHTPKEVTLDLFKTFTGGIETVRDQKLAKMLGASPSRRGPGSRRSSRAASASTTWSAISKASRDLFTNSGLAQVVHEESPGVEDSILFDLNHAIEVMSAIGAPVDEVVHDEDLRAKLEALRVSLKSAATTAGDMIARGAGLSFRLQRHGWRLTMPIDRRELLVGAAGGAALLALPFRPAKANIRRRGAVRRRAPRRSRHLLRGSVLARRGRRASRSSCPRAATTSRSGQAPTNGWPSPAGRGASASPFPAASGRRCGSPRSPTGISSAMAPSPPTASCCSPPRTTTSMRKASSACATRPTATSRSASSRRGAWSPTT